MKKRLVTSLIPMIVFFLVVTGTVFSQDFPVKPYPPRLVNDYAGMLKENEMNSLERKLVAFDDSSSVQIAVVIVNDLNGYAPGDYAQRLAEQWGIGRAGSDNGVLILVKDKTAASPKGEVFIAPGYGLEGVIPDIVCAEIIDKEILPSFRGGRYYEGIDMATDVIISLARGEYPPDQYLKEGDDILDVAGPFIFFIILMIIISFIRSNGGKNQRHISKNGLPLWMLLTMMNSGRGSHGGSWGGFSGGGGGFSGGGGGFGGFGGGSFGGGGAGGSW